MGPWSPEPDTGEHAEEHTLTVALNDMPLVGYHAPINSGKQFRDSERFGKTGSDPDIGISHDALPIGTAMGESGKDKERTLLFVFGSWGKPAK